MPSNAASSLMDEIKDYPENQKSRKEIESRFSSRYSLLRLGYEHCSSAKERWESTHLCQL